MENLRQLTNRQRDIHLKPKIALKDYKSGDIEESSEPIKLLDNFKSAPMEKITFKI